MRTGRKLPEYATVRTIRGGSQCIGEATGTAMKRAAKAYEHRGKRAVGMAKELSPRADMLLVQREAKFNRMLALKTELDARDAAAAGDAGLALPVRRAPASNKPQAEKGR
jgi:hypothetical protein